MNKEVQIITISSKGDIDDYVDGPFNINNNGLSNEESKQLLYEELKSFQEFTFYNNTGKIVSVVDMDGNFKLK